MAAMSARFERAVLANMQASRLAGVITHSAHGMA